jgi:hypothetical protein
LFVVCTCCHGSVRLQWKKGLMKSSVVRASPIEGVYGVAN